MAGMAATEPAASALAIPAALVCPAHANMARQRPLQEGQTVTAVCQVKRGTDARGTRAIVVVLGH